MSHSTSQSHSLRNQIPDYLPRFNGQVFQDHIMAYIRQTSRYLDGEMIPTLELANVEVDENARGRGVMTRFLFEFENLAFERQRVPYVENIHNPILFNILTRRGYKILTQDEYGTSTMVLGYK